MTSHPEKSPTAELTLTAFTSLDGVTQAPGGPTEDPSGDFRHGGWGVPHFDADMGSVMTDIFSKASAFLLGRRTYDIFASHWPQVTDPSDSIARALNTLPKFVASRSVGQLGWRNSTAVRDVVQEVTALKARLSGEIQVHGSANLAQTLIGHDLIDEYRLLTFPVLLGSGRRLFNRSVVPSTLNLVASRTTSKGVVFSVYRRSGRLATGNVVLQADGTCIMESNG